MDPKNTQMAWHALYVMPRSEKKVGKQIKMLHPGIEVCVPVQQQYRQWHDRKKLVEVVLFDSYVFVGLYPADRNKVFDVGNVLRYVHYEGRPAVLSRQEIAAIHQLGSAEYPVEILSGPMATGDPIEITSGKLKGLYGYVLAMNGTARVLVSIPSLGCFAKVELPRGELRRVGG